MSGQNPIIPSPTDAKGIDAVVYDLQTHLDFSLSWLTNGLGRAYRMAKVEVNKSTFYLPQIYLGTAKSTYFAGVPDNDKQGQNFIYVGDGVLTDPQNVGFYGYMEYPLSIVFSANLKLIDATLLETEDFTEHLISDVRQALIRNLIGKSYRLRVDNIQREFEDVFSEFDIVNNRGIDLLPLTHFRFNCTLLMKEVCNETTLNRCQAILANLTTADKLGCILPTYDFSSVAVQNALTPTQIEDLTAFIVPIATCLQLSTLLTTNQLLTCILPLYNFSNVATQAALSAQQKSDLTNYLLPLVNFADPAIQAIVTAPQQVDLQAWLCGGGGTQYSMSFDGVNEAVSCYDNAAYNFTNLQPFTITSWVKGANYAAGTQGIVTKRSGAAGGTGWTFYFYLGDLYVLLQVGAFYIQVRTNGVTFVNNTWYHLAATISGSGNATGVKIYRNGVQLSTVILSNNLISSISNTSPIIIGGETALPMPFNGKIGYSRLFNIEFSGAQVLTDYNGGVMLEESPEIANQVFGWKAGQGALYGTPTVGYWLFPNELDDTQLAPFSSNMEITDRTTDVPT